jgi:hypothetical protein
MEAVQAGEGGQTKRGQGGYRAQVWHAYPGKNRDGDAGQSRHLQNRHADVGQAGKGGPRQPWQAGQPGAGQSNRGQLDRRQANLTEADCRQREPGECATGGATYLRRQDDLAGGIAEVADSAVAGSAATVVAVSGIAVVGPCTLGVGAAPSGLCAHPRIATDQAGDDLRQAHAYVRVADIDRYAVVTAAIAWASVGRRASEESCR